MVKYGCMPLQLAVSVPSALRKDEIRAEGSDLCRACRDGAGYVRVIPEGAGKARFRVVVPGNGPELFYNDFSFDVNFDAAYILTLRDTDPESNGNDGLKADLLYNGLLPCVCSVRIVLSAERFGRTNSKVLFEEGCSEWSLTGKNAVTVASYCDISSFYRKYSFLYNYSLNIWIETDDPCAILSFEDLGCAAAACTYGGKKLTLKFNGTSL